MVPAGSLPYGPGMIPVMPYGQGAARKAWMDKKTMPSYAPNSSGTDNKKDKNDPSSKGQAGGKP